MNLKLVFGRFSPDLLEVNVGVSAIAVEVDVDTAGGVGSVHASGRSRYS